MKRGLLVLAVFLVCTPVAGAYEVKLSVPLGARIPDLAFDGLVGSADYGALGLRQQSGGFRLSDVPGDLLVLEFFNRLCMHCQRQAPFLEAFYRATTGDVFKGRVRVLSVGVGNPLKSLREFREEFHLTYPMAADPEYDRFMEMGDPGGTPLTVFLLRREGHWVLASSQMGLEGDTELVAGARVLLEGTGGTHGLSVLEGEGAGRVKRPDPEPNARERAKALLEMVSGGEVGLDAVEAAPGITVYRALGPDGRPSGLYARVTRREPVCDLCHAIRFVFAFDRAGTVRGFDPIYLTKYGNEEWNDEEVARMRGRLAGRTLRSLTFEPEVDAVTRATMSSSLIFDELRRTAPLLDALEKK